jgi:hypothetical protein
MSQVNKIANDSQSSNSSNTLTKKSQGDLAILNQKQKKANDDHKNQLSLKFVYGYFILLAGVGVFGFGWNYVILFYVNEPQNYFISVKDMFVIVGSAMVTPLGFIIAHYYKQS